MANGAVVIRTPSPHLVLLARIILAAMVIALLAAPFTTRVGATLIPLIRAELVWLDDNYRIESLVVGHEGADLVFRLRVSQARYIMINDLPFPPDPRGRANASTLVGNVVMPAILVSAICFAWPAKRSVVRIARVALLPLALALIIASDVPFVLWAAIWSLHVDAFAPELFSPLLIWAQFLQSGGRILLSILMGLILVSVGDVVADCLLRSKANSKAQIL